MSDYAQRLQKLLQLEFFGMKLGLENIRTLLETLGRPDRRFLPRPAAGPAAAGAVLSLGVGLAMRIEDWLVGAPLAIGAAWASQRRLLSVPALVGVGAVIGFLAVR